MDDNGLEALVLDRAMLAAYMDHTPDWVFFKDKNLRFTRVNVAMAHDLGVSAPSMAGTSERDYFSADDAEAAIQDEARVLETGCRVQSEVRWLSGAGGGFWASTIRIPWLDVGGEVLGTIGVTRDVSSLRAEVDLRQELTQLTHDLLHLALSDGVTGKVLQAALDRLVGLSWIPDDCCGAIFVVDSSRPGTSDARRASGRRGQRCGAVWPGHVR